MAVELSQFPVHVQTAIKAIDLPRDAHERVAKGIKWLEENAPLDWRLQMISIHGGKVYSQVRICRNDENPLALAFRRVQCLKGADGRVTWATILDAGLIIPLLAESCGFKERARTAPENVYIDEHIDGLFLDDAWANALGEYPLDVQPCRPYSQEIEQTYLLHGVAFRLARRTAA